MIGTEVLNLVTLSIQRAKSMGQDHPRTVVLIVHKQHVKTVKNALDARESLDRRVKVRPLFEELNEDLYQPDHFLITTNVPADPPDNDTRKALEALLLELNIEHPHCSLGARLAAPEIGPVPKGQNGLTNAVVGWLQELPTKLLQTLDSTVEQLLRAFPSIYSIYEPMLLLLAHSFQSAPWQRLLQSLDHNLQDLYTRLVQE